MPIQSIDFKIKHSLEGRGGRSLQFYHPLLLSVESACKFLIGISVINYCRLMEGQNLKYLDMISI